MSEDKSPHFDCDCVDALTDVNVPRFIEGPKVATVRPPDYHPHHTECYMKSSGYSCHPDCFYAPRMRVYAEPAKGDAPLPVSSAPALKYTNPKDAIGSGKLPTEIVPSVLVAEAATAFLEGALKYGRFNWRKAGVRASIYKAALDRHVTKWWEGEDRDPVTRVRHLANAAACIGILLDAELCGMLTDDRPPRSPIGKRIDEHAELVAHLKELFKDHNPHQYTIGDDDGEK